MTESVTFPGKNTKEKKIPMLSQARQRTLSVDLRLLCSWCNMHFICKTSRKILCSKSRNNCGNSPVRQRSKQAYQLHHVIATNCHSLFLHSEVYWSYIKQVAFTHGGLWCKHLHYFETIKASEESWDRQMSQLRGRSHHLLFIFSILTLMSAVVQVTLSVNECFFF